MVVSVSRSNRAESNRALKHPPQALFSFQNFVGRYELYAIQHSKQEQRAETPPSSSSTGGNYVHMALATRASTQSMLKFLLEKNKLTCALVAEPSRTRPARSGSTAALERVCMAEDLKKGSKAKEKRGEAKKRKLLFSLLRATTKVSRALRRNSSACSFETVLSLGLGAAAALCGRVRQQAAFFFVFETETNGEDLQHRRW